MTMFDRFRCRYLWWKGHSIPHIAYRLGCTMADVERVLFVKVTQ